VPVEEEPPRTVVGESETPVSVTAAGLIVSCPDTEVVPCVPVIVAVVAD